MWVSKRAYTGLISALEVYGRNASNYARMLRERDAQWLDLNNKLSCLETELSLVKARLKKSYEELQRVILLAAIQGVEVTLKPEVQAQPECWTAKKIRP